MMTIIWTNITLYFESIAARYFLEKKYNLNAKAARKIISAMLKNIFRNSLNIFSEAC